jgi:hypothetical protein
MNASCQSSGAESQNSAHGGRQVVDHHVEVELLRVSWVRPLRRAMIGRPLEGKPGRRVVFRDYYPVV